MHDNTRALPDRTQAILSVDVIVPKMGRRIRRLGQVSTEIEEGITLFIFRPSHVDETWKFIPTNSVACHALTVTEFTHQLRLHGSIDALWDEFEGHPVITLSLALFSSALVRGEPLVIARRQPEKKSAH